MTGPATPIPSDLAARLRAVLPSLSPAETRIAEIIEADPAGAAALTVNKLAERAATSAATVVRAARSLTHAHPSPRARSSAASVVVSDIRSRSTARTSTAPHGRTSCTP